MDSYFVQRLCCAINDKRFGDVEALMSEWEQSIVEQTLRALPTVVKTLVNHVAGVKEMTDKFYLEHPQAQAKKELVASLIEKVESENPGMEYPRILQKVGGLLDKATSRVDSLPMTRGSKPSLEQIDHLEGML